MQRSDTGTDDLRSLALVLAASGGLLGLVGILAGWFRVDIFAKSDIFGTQLLQSETSSGLSDMTGVVALAAGILVVMVVLWMLLFPHARLASDHDPRGDRGGLLARRFSSAPS